MSFCVTRFFITDDDFVTDCDFYIACLILRKQIQHIDGKKENIVVPSIRMKEIRDNLAGDTAGIPSQSVPSTMESNMDEEVPSSLSSSMDSKLTTSSTNGDKQSNDSSPVNPCVLCLSEERRLACLPCGHLIACVPCGHSLRSCPMCRRGIDAFVRIYA